MNKRRTTALFLSLAAFASAVETSRITLEGEDAACINCGVAKNHAGFTGTGFAAGLYPDKNSAVEFKVRTGATGPAKLTVRYSAGHGNVPMIVTANGNESSLTLPKTESWEVWQTAEITVDLKKGKNIIRFANDPDGKSPANIDHLAANIIPVSHPVAADFNTRINLLKEAGVDRLVVIARTPIKCSHTYTYFNEGFAPGGGLYTVDKNGFRQLVDASAGRILDASLSYDGKQILFSWKKDWPTLYDLYVINADGTGLRQLTKHPANDFNACWLPDGGIAFLSDRDNNYAYCHGSSSAVLYRVEPDASGLKRLSANYLSDFTPSVLYDGKIMYTRWEYVDRFQIPSQGLWAQNPDGTGLKHIYGGRMLNPVTLSEAKAIPGTRKIISVLSGHNNNLRGGIGIVDPVKGANSLDSLKVIYGEMVKLWDGDDFVQGKRNEDQQYQCPIPIDGKHFLVANRGNILLCDYKGETEKIVLSNQEDPATQLIGFYCAIPVKPHKREPAIRSGLPDHPAESTATVIMQDVYIGLEEQLAEGSMKRGDIKEIRVLECKGKQDIGKKKYAAFCWQFPVVSGGATMEPKKTISTVQVEEDGSALFEVPAMKPIILQALDAEGRTIQRMRTFCQFMPGEVQSCTGCHLDRNNAVPPANSARIIALQKPVQKINGAPWKENKLAFSYPEQVQPIWDRHCIRCHNARTSSGGVDLSGDLTDLFNVSYDNLVRTDSNKNPTIKGGRRWSHFEHKYITYIPSYNQWEDVYMAPKYFKPKSWGSYTSRLTQLIRAGHPDKDGTPRVVLDDMEKRIVYAWVDYNVPYYPTSHCNHPYLSHGMREMVPTGFDDLLIDVVERRCTDCHSTPRRDQSGWFSWNKTKDNKDKPRKIPMKHYLRWEKPELNSFMLAPLAKSAGGTEMCGKVVFKDTNDPDYQKLLRAFDEIHERVAKLPRMDMPGAEEVRGKFHLKLYTCKDQP